MSRRIALMGLALPLALAFGSAPALAAPYPPPSEGSAQVVPSRIRAGECATFSGDGFAALTGIAIADNGEPKDSTVSAPDGTFSKELCFGTDARPGRHELSGTGEGSQGDSLTVTAVLVIEGVRQSAGGPQPGSQPGSGAPQGPSVVVEEPEEGAGPEAGPGSPGKPGASGSSENEGVRTLAFALAGAAALFAGSLALLLAGRRRRRGTGAVDAVVG